MWSQTRRMVGSVCRDLGARYSGVACVNAQGVCETKVTKPRAMMSQKSTTWTVRSRLNHASLRFLSSVL